MPSNSKNRVLVTLPPEVALLVKELAKESHVSASSIVRSYMALARADLIRRLQTTQSGAPKTAAERIAAMDAYYPGPGFQQTLDEQYVAAPPKRDPNVSVTLHNARTKPWDELTPGERYYAEMEGRKP